MFLWQELKYLVSGASHCCFSFKPNIKEKQVFHSVIKAMYWGMAEQQGIIGACKKYGPSTLLCTE